MHEEEDNKSHTKINVVLLGESDVGKSTFLQCITQNISVGKHQEEIDIHPTNNQHCYTMETYLDSKKFVVELWDTQSFGGMKHLQFCLSVEANVILYLFSCDITNTFRHISDFVNVINVYRIPVPVILCCTKTDRRKMYSSLSPLSPLYFAPYIITTQMGVEKAKEIKAVAYVECSSFSGKGIKEALYTIIRKSPNNKTKKRIQTSISLYSTIRNWAYSKMWNFLTFSPTHSIIRGTPSSISSTFILTKLLEILDLNDFLTLRLISHHFYISLENPIFWAILCDKFLFFYAKSEVKNFKQFFMINYVNKLFLSVPDANKIKLHDYTVHANVIEKK